MRARAPVSLCACMRGGRSCGLLLFSPLSCSLFLVRGPPFDVFFISGQMLSGGALGLFQRLLKRRESSVDNEAETP